MSRNNIQTQLIKAGIKALKEYGYPNVTEDNIISDYIYSSFFRELLYRSKDLHGGILNKDIELLVTEIENQLLIKNLSK